MSSLPSINRSPVFALRGDSADLPLLLVNPDDGTPFNPTGNTLIFTLKASAWTDDTTALVQKISTTGGFTTTNASAGAVTLSLVPNDYTALSVGKIYQFDVQAQNVSSGKVKTVLRGTFSVDQDVTKLTTLSIPTYVLSPAFLVSPNWRPDIIGTVGGTGYIDGIPTVGLSKTVPSLMLTFFSNKLSAWVYTAGTTATGNGVVQPLDYDPSTNAGQWTQIALT